MDGLFAIVFSSVVAIGAGGINKTITEKYEYEDSAVFTQKYAELKDIGNVKLYFVKSDDPVSVSNNYCKTYGHDWEDKNNEARFEVNDSTQTLPIKDIIIKEGKLENKVSSEFIKRTCRQCHLNEYWSYTANITLSTRIDK